VIAYFFFLTDTCCRRAWVYRREKNKEGKAGWYVTGLGLRPQCPIVPSPSPLGTKSSLRFGTGLLHVEGVLSAPLPLSGLQLAKATPAGDMCTVCYGNLPRRAEPMWP
jgi:hypothetical protein